MTSQLKSPVFFLGHNESTKFQECKQISLSAVDYIEVNLILRNCETELCQSVEKGELINIKVGKIRAKQEPSTLIRSYACGVIVYKYGWKNEWN